MEIRELCFRTIFLAACAALAGIYLATGENLLLCGTMSVLGICLTWLYRGRHVTVKIAVILLMFFACALLSQWVMDHAYHELSGTKSTVTGRVISVLDRRDDRTVADIRPAGMFLPKIRVTVYGDRWDPVVGETVAVSGTLRKPESRTNPGGFDERKHLYADGVAATMDVRQGGIREIRSWHPLMWAGNTYRKIQEICRNYLGESRGSLLAGMLIGSKEGIDQERIEHFRRTGLGHTLAVSGSHVAYVLLPLTFFLSRLRMEQKRYTWFLILILAGFMVLTGMGPSVMRAGIMAGVFLTARFLEKDPDSLSSLAFSALVLIVVNPFIIYDAGFILSYACTGSMLLFYPDITDILGSRGAVSRAIALTLSVQLGSWVAAGKLFYTFHPYSVLANLGVFFIRMAVTITGWMMVVLGYLWDIPGRWLTWPTRILLSMMELTAEVIAGFPGSTLAIRYLPPMAVLLYLAGLYLIIVCRKAKHGFLALTLAGLVWLGTSLAMDSPKAVFYDVGQGDASLVKAGRMADIIIDTGRRAPLSSISHYTGQVIDMVFVTHSHEDHMGGLLDLAGRFHIRMVYFPDVADPALDAMEKKLKSMGIPVTRLRMGDTIAAGQAKIAVLHPEKARNSSINDSSLVLQLTYGDTVLLYTGDLEASGEGDILETGVLLDSHVLKVAHHGSDSSSILEFLRKVSPVLGVISTGPNRYGHPSPEVTARLSAIGAAVFRTDRDGCVTVHFGNNLRVHQAR